MLSGFRCVQNIKILGLTFTNNLFVSPHIHNIVTFNVQTLYALRILRAHGLCDKAIKEIFRCFGKLSYVSPAWLGFTKSKDRQTIDVFYDDAPWPISVLLINLHFMIYVPRRIVICFIEYSCIPNMFCTTCSLLLHPFHRQIHSDLTR